MQLNYKLYGEHNGTTPLLILHGLLGSLDNWQSQAKQLAEVRPVYTIDARNHGKSPHSDEFSYTLMVQDLEEFMDEHHIDQAILLGHSMGGKTVMNFAILHPERVEQLIVADIAPVQYPSYHDTIFEALKAVDIDNLTSRQAADDTLAQYIPDLGTRMFLMKGLTRRPEGGFRWKFNLEVLSEQYLEVVQAPDAYGKYMGPTLFIKGGNSKYVQGQYLEDIEMRFEHYTLTSIPDCGHWLHAEKPKEFLAKVQQFI